MTSDPGGPHPLRRRFRWFASQFLVVLSGIMVALAFQAWYESKQDRTRERAWLKQLLADLSADKAGIRKARDTEYWMSDGAYRLMLAAHSPERTSDATLSLWYGTSIAAASIPSATGTLVSLVQSGDIRLVRTDSLRSALIILAGRLERDIASLRALQSEVVESEARRDALVDFQGTQGSMASRPFPVEWPRVLRNPAFTAAMTTSWRISTRRWQMLRDLHIQLELIEPLIAADVYAPGERMPTTREVVALLRHASVDSVHHIYQHWDSVRPELTNLDRNLLNSAGYAAIQRSETWLAVKIFELCTLAYPENANPFDSLAEGLIHEGQIDGAIRATRGQLRALPSDPLLNYEQKVIMKARADQRIDVLSKLQKP